MIEVYSILTIVVIGLLSSMLIPFFARQEFGQAPYLLESIVTAAFIMLILAGLLHRKRKHRLKKERGERRKN